MPDGTGIGLSPGPRLGQSVLSLWRCVEILFRFPSLSIYPLALKGLIVG